ncbi:hypothetical protein LNTAR_04171 [Lentisphaera araneosa HTCC2155]|jgi:hypothetical protein|uniref:Uncharacterized protein n=1 Tax=Lentisphaera araneosa HTCC2155 TaxID=313628 RepID=A6DTY0_9BACT|nr:hypothetical protein [Lentisphaera araneosa]EDM24896.1 hypothetical protein LNTAR_04171 [Lentisphaera araneosa HTCC2155]
MKNITFHNLRMEASQSGDAYELELDIDSGHISFDIKIEIEEKDFEVLQRDDHRAALLHAALFTPFQLKATALDLNEQRKYLDIILHSTQLEVERFLTKLDHGRANGAISNMMRITSQKDPSYMRKGYWFDKK